MAGCAVSGVWEGSAGDGDEVARFSKRSLAFRSAISAVSPRSSMSVPGTVPCQMLPILFTAIFIGTSLSDSAAGCENLP